MIDQTITKAIICKYCGSNATSKFGTYNGKQRYWCNTCNRKFKSDDSAFRSKLPSNYICQAIAEYYRGNSLGDIMNWLDNQYGYLPSKSLVWKWINKYTSIAVKSFKDDKPEVGTVWVVDETMLSLYRRQKIWIYNVVDLKTKFLLSSDVAICSSKTNAQSAIYKAQNLAAKNPHDLINYSDLSYEDQRELDGDYDVVPLRPPLFKGEKIYTVEKVQRYHGNLKGKSKVRCVFRNVENFVQFNNGWFINYNYFRPHSSLEGKTPAEAAGIKYNIKNWDEVLLIQTPNLTQNLYRT